MRDKQLLAVALGLLLAQPAAAQRRRPIERLTLEAAVARATARNTDVLVAAAEVRRADGLVAQARSSSLPTLLPGAAYTRIDAARTFDGEAAIAADQWTATAPLTLPVLVPQAWAVWAHARDDRKVAELNAARVRRQVAIAVANTYLTVITQRRRLDLSVVARDYAAAHLEIARAQEAAGAVSELDVVRSRQQLQLNEAQVQVAIVALLRAQEALGVLLGGERPIDALEPPRFRVPGPEDRPGERADLQFLRMRQTAISHRVRDNYTEYLPSLTGSFQPIFTDPPTFIQPRWGWQLTLNLVVPLYDGGLRRGRQRERSALLDEATLSLEGGLRSARSEIRLGQEAMVHADASARQSRMAAELARRALEISTARYRQGAASNLEVIDALREARQNDLAAALAEDEAQQIRLDLLAASGGFP